MPLFKTLFEKLSELSSRPALKKEDDEKGEAGLKVGRRVHLAFKMLYDCPSDKSGTSRDTPQLGREEFFLLVRTICHPLVSARGPDLMGILRSLTEIMEK